MGDTMYVRVMFFDLKINFIIKTACFETLSFTEPTNNRFLDLLSLTTHYLGKLSTRAVKRDALTKSCR